MPDQTLIKQFKTEGFAIARSLFSAAEAEAYKAHYMALRETDKVYPRDQFVRDPSSPDPLKRYPRLLHMQRWDQTSLDFMLDQRIRDHLVGFYNVEPYGVQTMFYFKPPGARGQALHQDEFFINVQPGTCVAAWMAIDPCDEENGCLHIVPWTHDIPILCTIEADTTDSFQDITVPLPDGMASVPIVMNPGDVLFFNGRLIHGSFANRTADRWRRGLVAHYVDGHAEQLSQNYRPIWRFDGSTVDLEDIPRGGDCGSWVEIDGTPAVEITGRFGDFHADDFTQDLENQMA